jgi:hypothetical protein
MAGFVPGAVLDWPRKWRDSGRKPSCQIINQMNTDTKYSVYFENTLRFVEYSEKNKDWYKGGGNISVKS